MRIQSSGDNYSTAAAADTMNKFLDSARVAECSSSWKHKASMLSLCARSTVSKLLDPARFLITDDHLPPAR